MPRPGAGRWFADLGGALAASPKVRRGFVQSAINALVLFAAAVPFAGWGLPTAWLGATLAVVVADNAWRSAHLKTGAVPDFRPFEWLLSFGYAAAAAFLVTAFNGPAQTLGVTVFGVMLFQILARDYAEPRRMLLNLAPPVAALVLVQGLAAVKFAVTSAPWEIVTLAASPYVVFRAFRVVYANLSLSREAADRRQAEAEAASHAKSAFLATVSHEIRTPLNGVLGMAQAMARDELPDRQRERLEVLGRSGETLLALLNDVLDLSKIEAGKLVLECADVDLAEIAESVGAAFAANAAAKGLALNVHIDDAARGLWRGDALRLRQVLANLVSNAVKFTPAGEVEVALTASDGGVRMFVRDTGVGIDAERIPGLFQKFVQADSSTTRRFGGTGLGLAICAELTRAMGGGVRVNSEPGAGSLFTVELPLARGAANPVTTGAAELDERERHDLAPAAARPLRVLAAEDNRVNQLVLQALLAQLEIAPTIVETGDEAVAAWEREPWDLILMDVQMPVMDGVAATREIRAREAAAGHARTPIIALTANAMTHQLAEYLGAGMDAVVAKPINIEELFAAIGEVAHASEAAADAATSQSARA